MFEVSNNSAASCQCIYDCSLRQYTSMNNKLESMSKATEIWVGCITHTFHSIGGIISNYEMYMFVFNPPVFKHVFVLRTDVFPSVRIADFLSKDSVSEWVMRLSKESLLTSVLQMSVVKLNQLSLSLIQLLCLDEFVEELFL